MGSYSKSNYDTLEVKLSDYSSSRKREQIYFLIIEQIVIGIHYCQNHEANVDFSFANYSSLKIPHCNQSFLHQRRMFNQHVSFRRSWFKQPIKLSEGKILPTHRPPIEKAHISSCSGQSTFVVPLSASHFHRNFSTGAHTSLHAFLGC